MPSGQVSLHSHIACKIPLQPYTHKVRQIRKWQTIHALATTNSQMKFNCPDSESPTTYINMCSQLMYEPVTCYQKY